MTIYNAFTIYGIFAVISGLSSRTAVTAWSVTEQHSASMGHHASSMGHHHHYHTTSPHGNSFSQAPSQYSHIQYTPNHGYSHDERDMLRRVEWVRQQREGDSQPAPLFTAVAAAAASGESFVLNVPLRRTTAAAAATNAATEAATAGYTPAAAATTGAARLQAQGRRRRQRTVIIGPVSLQRAAVTAGYQLSQKRPKGPCSMWFKRVFIVRVKSAADFAARASLPRTATVILHLQKDLMLPKGVIFGRQQSCTILMSAKWPGYTLTGGNPMYPVLRVWNTSNFMSLNVNYRLPVTESSPECTIVPELGKGVTCPAISIHRSFGVQIGKRAPLTGQGVAELGKEWQRWARSGVPRDAVLIHRSYGVQIDKVSPSIPSACCAPFACHAPFASSLVWILPVDVVVSTVFGPVGVQWSMAMPRAAGLTNAHWSGFSLFFSSHTSSQAPACLQATPYPVYLSPPQGKIFGRVDVLRSMDVRLDSLSVTGVASFIKSPGVIRVALCGYGPGLLKSSIVISNNEVYGVNTPILLHRGAVGVTVRNNYVHDFIFAGIKCGADVHYSFACMLSRINSNLVVSSGRNLNGDHDSAGIYFYTHWFSPGNSALCNYVFNGDHCYYLDHCSSGVLVRGGACVNTYDGMKVNNGKRNVITNVAMKGTRGSLGWTSCFTVTVNNCLKDPGNYWEAMRVKYYNSARINH
ncbi:unnamed protein product, partial [Closterium sp. NIES-65]